MASSPSPLSPPPVRTKFAGTDPSGSGISWPWLKWFQEIFTQLGKSLVGSVFGRTGNVVAQAGDYGPTKGGTGQTSWQKGDLLVGSGTDTTNLKDVGADGTILTADSSKPDGLDWKSPSSTTSVTLTMPAEFNVSGSGSAALSVVSVAQSPNSVWSGPLVGGPAPPSFSPIASLVASFLNFSDAETPAGTVDGVNSAFTVTYPPNPANSLQLFENIGGAGTYDLKIQGVDYTLSGNTITYTVAPTVGSLHITWYRHL